MRVINQSVEWVQKPGPEVLELIEACGRTCYKSEDRITPGSAEKFVAMILKRGHESVLEHTVASLRFITSRDVTHEMVRHRLAAYSQESQRYVGYRGEIEFIRPVWCSDAVLGDYPESCLDWPDEKMLALIGPDVSDAGPEWAWVCGVDHAAGTYGRLLAKDWRPEQARTVLPNSTKTEIVMTANLREWRHVFRLRTSPAAYPPMRALMLDALAMMRAAVPVVFDDLGEVYP